MQNYESLFRMVYIPSPLSHFATVENNTPAILKQVSSITVIPKSQEVLAIACRLECLYCNETMKYQ